MNKTATMTAVKAVQSEKALSIQPAEKPTDSASEKREADRAAYEADACGNLISAFFASIEENAMLPVLSSGFPTLDTLFDGQIYPEFYVLGAPSSLGKTTLALQIADNVAAAGNDVLYFSLEQARFELMGKSVSRLSYEIAAARRDMSLASPFHTVMNQKQWAQESPEARCVIRNAATEYAKRVGTYLHIIESVGDLTAEDIRAAVEKHRQISGAAPRLVVVDYLQILKPVDAYLSDKQNCDNTVHALKQLSRDYKMAVFALSSFNRESYDQPVSMGSFKESGGVEYGCDVLLAMQYAGMDYEDLETGKNSKNRIPRILGLKQQNDERSRNAVPVAMQIKLLKGRCGPKNSASLDYIQRYNVFLDSGEASGVTSTAAGENPAAAQMQMELPATSSTEAAAEVQSGPWGQVETAREKRKRAKPKKKAEPLPPSVPADDGDLPF